MKEDEENGANKVFSPLLLLLLLILLQLRLWSRLRLHLLLLLYYSCWYGIRIWRRTMRTGR